MPRLRAGKRPSGVLEHHPALGGTSGRGPVRREGTRTPRPAGPAEIRRWAAGPAEVRRWAAAPTEAVWPAGAPVEPVPSARAAVPAGTVLGKGGQHLVCGDVQLLRECGGKGLTAGLVIGLDAVSAASSGPPLHRRCRVPAPLPVRRRNHRPASARAGAWVAAADGPCRARRSAWPRSRRASSRSRPARDARRGRARRLLKTDRTFEVSIPSSLARAAAKRAGPRRKRIFIFGRSFSSAAVTLSSDTPSSLARSAARVCAAPGRRLHLRAGLSQCPSQVGLGHAELLGQRARVRSAQRGPRRANVAPRSRSALQVPRRVRGGRAACRGCAAVAGLRSDSVCRRCQQHGACENHDESCCLWIS